MVYEKESHRIVDSCVVLLNITSELRGYFLIVAASVLWGTMGILAKFSYEYGVQPATLIALRQIAGFTTLLVVLVLFDRRSLKVEKRDVALLLVLGVFAVSFQRVSYFYSISFTTATVAAILFYTYPVFVNVFAWFFLREKVAFGHLVAIVLTFLGVAFVVRVYDVAALRVNFVGILFGLACSLLFVLYFLLTKRLRSRYAGWTLTLYGDGIGALVLLPVVAVSYSEVVVFPVELWLLILAIAWFPSLLAYVLYSSALKFVRASKGSVLSVIEPLSAAVLSMVFIGERLELLQTLGIAVALAGVVLLFRKSKA